MGIERGELPWPDIIFQSKTQTNKALDLCVQKVLAFPGVSKKLNEASVKKAVTRVRLVLTDKAAPRLGTADVSMEY